MTSDHDVPPPTTDPVALPRVLASRTIRLEGAAVPESLLDLLPPDGGLAWLRRGDGLVAWGELGRVATSGAGRFARAESAWRAAMTRARVHDEVRVPGTGPVAFGSFAFDDGSPCGGALVVPRVVVGRRHGVAWMTTMDDGAKEPSGVTARPAAPLRQPAPAPPGAVSWSEGALSTEDWQDTVARAVARIRSGQLDKVVLARDVVASAERELDARWLLQRLADRYASCWTFAVDGLVGATPELLVRSEKGLVTSRVLAGTIRRTGDDQADLVRAALLAHSSKDREEHEYAVESLRQALEPFCSSANVPETPFVLHLPNVLHLATDITAVLSSEGGRAPSSLALAAALHPTAAVAGTPTAAATALIGEIEGMDRGRYAGPVGWLGADGDGEWGIALRSAELSGNDPRRLRLFAGCGVVAASVPSAELAESEAKLEPMRHALRSD